MRRSFEIIAVVLLLATHADAHELKVGVGTQTSFFFHADHLEIEYNFGISSVESWNYLGTIDTNLDNRVSEEEAFAFIDEWGPKLIATMDLKINGSRPTTFEIVERREVGIQGRIMARGVDAYYKIRCPLPAELATGGWWLHYRDTSFRDVVSSQFSWIRMQGQGEETSFWIFEPQPFAFWGGDYQMGGRALIAFFDDEFRSDIQPGTTPIPEASQLVAQVESSSMVPSTSGERSSTESTPQPGEDEDATRVDAEPTPTDPASVAPPTSPRALRPLLLALSSALILGGTIALVVHLRRR